MFILRGHAGFDLANLLSLGSKALAAMTSLLVRLNTWPCPNGHEILDHRRTRCMKCNNEVAADPICNSYGLKLRTKGNFLKQWEQACSHLASGISLGQLHLTFICDVEDLAAGEQVLAPLTNLPKLKACTIRLGRLRNRDLASLAERTSQKMTSTFIPGSGFPFELLPEEIRLRVLQFTHIGPNGPYHDRYEDLFVESGKLIKNLLDSRKDFLVVKYIDRHRHIYKVYLDITQTLATILAGKDLRDLHFHLGGFQDLRSWLEQQVMGETYDSTVSNKYPRTPLNYVERFIMRDPANFKPPYVTSFNNRPYMSHPWVKTAGKMGHARRSQSVSPDRVGLLEAKINDDQATSKSPSHGSLGKINVKPIVLLSMFIAIAAFSIYLINYTTRGWISVFKSGSEYQVHAPLQDIVTWDQHSLFVRGERIMLYSGEFHPYRLPVPGLWLDVLQKIKALGFNAVSFYTNWGLLEGREGDFSAEGIFALEPFFQAASKAGIYLIARPGPYINAESSGGGFPGWLQRTNSTMRTTGYLRYTENYVRNIASIVAKAQIVHGGPIVIFQSENEYSYGTPGIQFPDNEYFAAVKKQYRDAGIVVPLISNDGGPYGLFAPGTGPGAVDIYGHDGYPLGFDCANPSLWPEDKLPTDYNTLHQQQSPSTPYAIMEFQAGSFDPWGGSSFKNCTKLINEEFARVFYKNNYAAGIKIFNLYMIYGGTNWGNSGHPGGYTSYDYGAAIAEDRTVSRVKYHEIKLQANFLKVSPAYLTAKPEAPKVRSYTSSTALTVTRLVGNVTSFYVVRHEIYSSTASINYRLTVPTSSGNIDVPQLGGSLSLSGRDSKIHVTDYYLGGPSLLYCSAEIFTWKKYPNKEKTILLLYGNLGETHEAAFKDVIFDDQSAYELVEWEGEIKTSTTGDMIILNWTVTLKRKVVRVGQKLFVYLLDRNDAYNYWVLDVPGPSPFNSFAVWNARSVIVRMSFPQWKGIRPGYLIRTVDLDPPRMLLTGDLNETSVVEVIGGVPPSFNALAFNGRSVSLHRKGSDVLEGFVPFLPPKLTIPKLTDLVWKCVDSLPEILASYDDSAWPQANLPYSNNTVRSMTTPVSLYGSDYGFHTGNLLFRGRFTAQGKEETLKLETQGGTAFAVSVFLNQTYLGSFSGNSAQAASNLTLTLPDLTASQDYFLTILMDNMGLDENFIVGEDASQRPRGILNYDLSGRHQSAIKWKITGNLGGEYYRDRVRGPLNEGGLYAERKGYHLPKAPTADWMRRKPTEGIPSAGVGFFTTSFALDVPTSYAGTPVRYDIPLSFFFTNTTTTPKGRTSNFRAQLYVNGYQYGKYVNNIGPQTAFPVPEGILNYHGMNYIAISLWAMDAGGAKLENVELVSTAVIQTGYREVEMAPGTTDEWKERQGSY
ncbi:MAG: hypothetical protein MMC33_001005 [Icmadophila ericetorum]|nr:hypothetical protein [Icmadophila ericetorum]